jgi:hypothetical protein
MLDLEMLLSYYQVKEDGAVCPLPRAHERYAVSVHSAILVQSAPNVSIA